MRPKFTPAAKRRLAGLLLACALVSGSLGAVARANGNDGPLFDALRDPLAERLSTRLPGSATQDVTWEAEAELGYLATGGNLESRSAHARTRVFNDRPHWRHAVRVEALLTEAPPQAASQQRRANLHSAYKLTADDYLFAALRYDHSDAQGIAYRYSEVAGYGRRVLHGEKLTVVLELGAGGGQARRTDRSAAQQGPVGIAIGELTWKPRAQSTLNTYLVLESREDNRLLLSQTSLTLLVAGGLSARLSYELTHNSEVPAGVVNTDRTSSVTLVYKF